MIIKIVKINVIIIVIHIFKNLTNKQIIKNSGWHLSFFLSINDIKTKLLHSGDWNDDNIFIKNNIKCYISTCHHIQYNRKRYPNTMKIKGIRDKYIYNNLIKNICKNNKTQQIYPKYMVNQACINNTYYLNFFPKINNLKKCDNFVVMNESYWPS